MTHIIHRSRRLFLLEILPFTRRTDHLYDPFLLHDLDISGHISIVIALDGMHSIAVLSLFCLFFVKLQLELVGVTL